MTPRYFTLAAATLSLLALTSPASSDSAAPLERIQERVVVAPLNLTVRAPEALAGRMDPVWAGLLDYFYAQDRRVSVLSPVSAERHWLEATAGLDKSDRKQALRTATAHFATSLAGAQDYELLIVPSIVLRPAKIRGREARWDGTSRVVPGGDRMMSLSGVADATRDGVTYVKGLAGEVAAASLHVSVYAPDGTLVHEGIGPLDVVQEAKRSRPVDGRWTFAVRQDPFGNADHVREGMEKAFAPGAVANRATW